MSSLKRKHSPEDAGNTAGPQVEKDQIENGKAKGKRVCTEDEGLGNGPRPKFGMVWKNTQSSLINDEDGLEKTLTTITSEMADALWEMEEKGATPVMSDGKVGGNAAAAVDVDGKRCVLVTKSGKLAKQRVDMMKDTCIVTDFDEDKWKCEYYAASATVLPTSDVPMHVAALNAHKRFDWSEIPGAVLHGHAIEKEEDGKKLDIPCSSEATVFSTPEDTAALMTLLEAYPYPKNKIFIRKDHGFLVLGKDMKDALSSFRQRISPYI